jgi:hypothetical protein
MSEIYDRAGARTEIWTGIDRTKASKRPNQGREFFDNGIPQLGLPQDCSSLCGGGKLWLCMR